MGHNDYSQGFKYTEVNLQSSMSTKEIICMNILQAHNLSYVLEINIYTEGMETWRKYQVKKERKKKKGILLLIGPTNKHHHLHFWLGQETCLNSLRTRTTCELTSRGESDRSRADLEPVSPRPVTHFPHLPFTTWELTSQPAFSCDCVHHLISSDDIC